MVLVDTSIWIEFLRANPYFFQKLSSLVEDGVVVGLECIFGELLQGTRNPMERSLIQNYWTHLSKMDENGIWVEAGIFSAENKLYAKGVGLIDAAIIIGARRACAKIWTQDKKLLAVLERDQIYHPL